MGGLGHQRHEIPERVVCAGRLWHRVVGLGLQGVHEVRELHRVLNEEDGDVVADEVPVAFVRVELHREAPGVAHRVGRAAFAGHRREAREHGSPLPLLREERRPGDPGQRLEALEEAVCARAARVDDAFRDPLVVEVRDLLAQHEVLEQRRPAQTRLERALVVCDRHALVGRQHASARVAASRIQGCVRGALSDPRAARAELFGIGSLADGAGRHQGVGRFPHGTGLCDPGGVTVLARLRLVVRHRSCECFAALELASESRRVTRGRRGLGRRAVCGLGPLALAHEMLRSFR